MPIFAFQNRLIDFAIEHSRTTFLILLAIIAFGLLARLSIPIESEPVVEIPKFNISVKHEGISSNDATSLLIAPLEQELRKLENVIAISSTAAKDIGVVSVEYSFDTDTETALGDVRDAVNRARQQFPTTAEEPVVNTESTGDQPILQINLVGLNTPEDILHNAAYALQKRIEVLPDIKHVVIQGAREEYLEILIDPSQLRRYDISSESLLDALARNNRLIPAGTLDSSQGNILLKIPSIVNSEIDLYDLPVRSSGNSVVVLGDIATIERAFKDREVYSHANGNDAISVFVYRRADAHLPNTSHAVKQAVESYRPTLPPSVMVFYSQDLAALVGRQVSELENNLITSVALIMMVILLTLGFRGSLIVGLAIPVVFLFTLLALWLVGLSFNFMVLCGMLMGLGMLVDSVIVVTEDAERMRRDGIFALEAYRRAAHSMVLPVAGSSLTVIVAVLPILFWPESEGELLKYIPIAVVLVLFGAVLYAFIFAPAIGVWLSKKSTAGRVETSTVGDFESVESELQAVSGLKRLYLRLLEVVVKHPFWTLGLIAICVGWIFMYHNHKNLGVILFSENDPQSAHVYVRARGNSSVEEAYSLAKEVEFEILQIPGIENLNLFVSTGSKPGNGLRQHGIQGSAPDLISTFYIEMASAHERVMSGVEILEEIRDRVEPFAGLVIDVVPFQSEIIPPKPIVIRLSSFDQTELESTVWEVLHYLETEIEGLRDFEDTLPRGGLEWKLTVDKAAAALYGVDTLAVGLATQLVTNGVNLGEYKPRDSDESLDIRVRYPNPERDVSSLDELEIVTDQGLVPVSNFVERVAATKSDSIERRNQRYVHTLRVGVDPTKNVSQIVSRIQTGLQTLPLHRNVDIEYLGQAETLEKSLSFYVKGYAIALLLMFILLVLQYDRLYQAIATFFAIVLSTSGVFLGLALMEQPFSAILSGIGMYALAGIVIYNNVVLVATFNASQKVNPGLDDATLVIHTATRRLKPILLTTSAVIFAVLPLATHNSIDLINRSWIYGSSASAYWVPIAQVILFGIVSAAVLTLIATPAMLVIPEKIREFGRNRLSASA